MDLRNASRGDGKPISIRQLESLIRLTEARARIDLRNEATETDARDIIDLMQLTACSQAFSSKATSKHSKKGSQRVSSTNGVNL